jgi:hypothetical protein
VGRQRLRWAVPDGGAEDDLVVVLNQWNIVPGQRSLSWRTALTRVLQAVTDRAR